MLLTIKTIPLQKLLFTVQAIIYRSHNDFIKFSKWFEIVTLKDREARLLKTLF
jgi:hypothetical protein